MTHTDDRPPPVDEEPPWDDPGEPALPPPPGPADSGRTPPQDQAAERMVLGAAIISTNQLDAAAQILTGADFWRPNHETIWRALRALRAEGNPTSIAALAARLLDDGDLHAVGGPTYLHDLEHQAYAVTDVTFYADRVDSLARRRRAIERLTAGLQQLSNPGPDTDVDTVLNTAATQLAEARDNLAGLPTVTTWSPVDLAAVLQGEMLDPPPTMLQRSDGVYLFYDGAVHTVSGESESGKTWLCLLAALQLMQVGERCVFVDFEDRADRVVARLLALGALPQEIRDHFAYVRPDRPLDDDGRAQLAPAITDARLVILDGVTEAMTIHGYDLNSNADSALFQGMLPRWIADHGPAVAMIDHVVKDKEKQDRFALGAQHKLAGIDGAAYIVKMIQPFGRGKRGLARVEVAKDRPGHVREHTRGRTIAEFTLDSSVDELILVAHLMPLAELPSTAGGGESFEPTALMEKISRYVQANPGMSKKAIEAAMNGKATTIRLALELLVTREYIGIKSGTRGAVQHFHHKTYWQPGQGPSDDEQEE